MKSEASVNAGGDFLASLALKHLNLRAKLVKKSTFCATAACRYYSDRITSSDFSR